jgi:hypothetical protein
MAVSTESTALDWVQRRHQMRNASSTPSPITVRPSGSRPLSSWWAIGPSIRALIWSGIMIDTATPASDATSMTDNARTCGRR